MTAAGPEIRTLGNTDQADLEAFLGAHADGSLPLLAQVQREGTGASSTPQTGTHYLGIFDRGNLKGILALGGNDLVYLQCPQPDDLARLLEAWRQWFDGGCLGLVGPRAQVEHAIAALGGEALPFRLNNTEQTFMRDLTRPLAPLPQGLAVRPARGEDMEGLYGWRTAFLVETLALPLTPALVEQARTDLDLRAEAGHLAVLAHEGITVGMGLILTELTGTAQLGGLYIPPQWRQRGYARSLLTGLCTLAQTRGNRLALLFSTRRHVAINRAAVTAGFQPRGDFGIVLFDRPVSPPNRVAA